MRKRRPALAAPVLAAVLAGCGSRGAEVRIAVAVPLTGDAGTEGQGIRRAVELAVEEANVARRFPFRVGLRALDDRADPEEAVNVANLIVSDPGVLAVIGHYNSGCAIEAARVYAKAGLPMIVPAATNPRVTSQQLEPGWPGPRNVFRVIPTDDVEGEAAGDFLVSRLRARRIAVLHDGTAYGKGLAEEVRRRALSRGAAVAAFEEVSVGEKEFGPILSRLRNGARADAVYFGGLYAEAGLLVKQMRGLGWRAPFVAGEACNTANLFAVAGAAADGVYVCWLGVPVATLPAGRAFLRRYSERFPSSADGLKPFDAFAYEAAEIALDALAKAGPNRGALLSAIRASDREGVLGRTRFDAKGDTLNTAVSFLRADARSKSFVPLR